MADTKPFILVLSHFLTGHVVPMTRIAAELASASWPVFFLGTTAHQARIEASGATFIPLTGLAHQDELAYYRSPPTADYATLPWRDRALVDLRVQCIEPLPYEWQDVCRALVHLANLDPSRRVIVVCDAWFFGALPLRLGAPLPPGCRHHPRSVGVSVTAMAIHSIDQPPPCGRYDLPAFEASVAGRAINAAAWARWEERARPLTQLLADKLAEAGAARPLPGPFLGGGNYTAHDALVHLSVPSFEYPRSDWPPGFRFGGLVQRRPPGGWNVPRPSFSWWSELEANSALGVDDEQRKKVCVVAQGTVGMFTTGL